MAKTDPPKGQELHKGGVIAGAKLIEPMARGERISLWRAQREDGASVTVHALTGAVREREKNNFLKGARRLAVLTRDKPLKGVVEIDTVVPNVPAYVAAGGTAGTMVDVSILGWGVRETIRFMRRLSRAVGTLHENGVAHGCLRPANVLLDDDLNPRLSDPGMLIIDDSYDGPSDMKHDYAAYAAREVRLGKKPDIRSDVFSLGRLLYFALLGSEPDETDEDTPLLAALENEPPGLVRIIRRCTLRAPEGRYANVNELMRDLGNWREADSVGTTHPMGREGDRDDSSTPGDSDPPSYPDRPSLRPSENDPGPSTGERQAPAVPIRGYVAPPEEEDDVLTPVQAYAGAAFGAVGLATSLLLAYYSAMPTTGVIAGAIAGAVGFSLIFPPIGRPFVSRFLVALAAGFFVWYLNPATELAERGRKARVEKGTPLKRGRAVAQLKAKGVRAFQNYDMRGVVFNGLNLPHIQLRFSKLDGAQFVGTTLVQADFSGASVAGADFSGADLTNASFSTAVGWQDTVCDGATVMPSGWVCDDGAPLASVYVGSE